MPISAHIGKTNERHGLLCPKQMIPMTIGTKIIFEEQLPSTNTYAIKLLSSEKPPEGTIVRAAYQSAGRGQPGNRWESEKDKNLLISIILYPEMVIPAEQFIVSMTISLGIHDFVSRHVKGSSIKWPNDIYVKDDKIAGILIESSTIGNRVHYMVAGIGLNINQEKFHSDAPNPVSLKQITGKDYDLESCLRELSNDLDLRYMSLKNGEEEHIIKEYHRNLYRYGIPSKFADISGQFTGVIKKVDTDGALMIQKKSGGLSYYYFKEVEFISEDRGS